MKRILLFASLTFGIAGLAQDPINNFAGVATTSPDNLSGDGINSRIYYRGVFEQAPDETSTGAAASWDFNSVVFEDAEVYNNSAPSTNELTEYPGCNFVSTGSDQMSAAEVGKLFGIDTAGGFTILGNTSDMFSLKFSGDGGFVGQFPMSFAATSSDIVSGTFDYSGPEGNFSGNFTGTMTSTYDAYGSLSYQSSDPAPIQANRLNVIMNLTFGTVDFPNAGTIIQTSHFYYKQPEFGLWPFIRSVRNQISVPTLDINMDTTVLERADEVLLLNTQTVQAEAITLSPNPVKNILTISGNSQNRSTVFISDMNGRVILNQQTSANTIDLSSLQNGMYLVRITTDTGSIVKKIIKS